MIDQEMMREVIAKAIADCIQGRESWHDDEPAQAALDAIHAAGFVIVPNQENQND